MAITVLVVDDSPTVRAYLRSLIEEDREIQVVGEATDGNLAVAACALLQPQVVTMDLVMPSSGVDAIRQIMEENPTPIVVVSALAEYEKDLTVYEALAAGALSVVRRPPSRRHPEFAARHRELLDAVKTAAGITLVRRKRAGVRPKPAARAERDSSLQLVGIGASTGGPAAIMKLLQGLPKAFAPSIAIVQHITPGFTSGLVEWLNGSSPLPVRLAKTGMRLPWHGALVAPDDSHLTIRHGTVYLDQTAPRNGHRPSVDPLFESMADWKPRACVGILMTGMGEDGARGLRRLRTLGGHTVIQTEETCVVFGMPGTAWRMRAAEHALSPDAIAHALTGMAEAA
jgi:two-component system chemotaxis response regulator CheB